MGKHKCVQVDESDLSEAIDGNMGWCPTCKEFTRECTEPDAEDYDCPVCDGNEVVGAEQALINGLITI